MLSGECGIGSGRILAEVGRISVALNQIGDCGGLVRVKVFF